ncbi:MAG: 3'-5' exonuclease, partial [Myxococcota bacterium]
MSGILSGLRQSGSYILAAKEDTAMTADYYLVIDLEATCDDAGAVPKHESEIIEIGAVLADAFTLAPCEEFQTFVRPVRHPTLTEFCVGLTHITQDHV